MFAGKTEELIRRLRLVHYAKHNAVAIKPSLDDRFHGTNIVSHAGEQITAMSVAKAKDILTHIQSSPVRIDVVGIDEVQFFDDQIVEVCTVLAGEGRRVIVAGLDTDYRGLPFGPMPHLLAISDFVSKVSAVCTTCGSVATRSQRIVNSQEQIVVGGLTAYEARCRKHWSPEPVFSRREAREE
jgi:thymidine kinase